MALEIIQMTLPQSKYDIKCPYAMPNPSRVVVHNTASDASAKSEISYMQGNGYEVSYHYAVDDVRAVQGLPLNRNGWHAGDGQGAGNRQGIGVEICYSKSGGDRFVKAEKNGALLVAMILVEKGWGLDRVTKHQDYWQGTYYKYCPHRTLDLGWQRFLNMVQAEVNNLKKQPSEPSVSFSGQGHIESKGWVEMSNGIIGTVGKGLRLEAFGLVVKNEGRVQPITGSIHVQDIGNVEYDQNTNLFGTIGQGKRLESVLINVGNGVQYRTHIENVGWTEWVRSGEWSGTKGRGLRIEAIEFRVA